LTTPQKSQTSHLCPVCKNKLLYDGQGFSCMSCSHIVRSPESDKLIQIPPPVREADPPEPPAP